MHSTYLSSPTAIFPLANYDYHGALYVSVFPHQQGPSRCTLHIFLVNYCTVHPTLLRNYKDHHGALYVSFLANCNFSSCQLRLSRCTLRIFISSPTRIITVHSTYLSSSTAFFLLVTATITVHSTYLSSSTAFFPL